MNENIDLIKILKDCPEGTKFWHSMHGEVTLVNVDNNPIYSIGLKLCDGGTSFLAKDGHYREGVGDCLLWPSKECRDWSKFKISKPKFDIRSLKPFDKVLVRDHDTEKWRCSFFSHIIEHKVYKYVTITEGCYICCIPYNDDTKHLVGTTDDAPDYYKYWVD